MIAENTNSLVRDEIERITHKDYPGSLNHRATSVLSQTTKFSLCNQSQITQTPHTRR